MESAMKIWKAVRWSARAGVMTGIGTMAAVDEIVFHQILAWHHFYEGATEAIGLLADGFLHAFELILLVAGFFLMLDLRRKASFLPKIAWAGACMGAGGFQLFDGLVNHKVLRLHQVRYVSNVLPYDIVWNIYPLLYAALSIKLGKVFYTSRRAPSFLPRRISFCLVIDRFRDGSASAKYICTAYCYLLEHCASCLLMQNNVYTAVTQHGQRR